MTKMSLSLYAHGLHLNPDMVTARLGIRPTIAQKAGEVTHLSSGRDAVQKTGVWAVRLHFNDVEINEALHELVAKLGDHAGEIKFVGGVEDAYLDIFMAGGVDQRGGNEILISADNLAAIASFGLPVQITLRD